MRSNHLVLVAAVASALGLSACSDGDRSSLTIEGDTINEAPSGGTPPPGNGVSTCPSFASARPQTATGTNVCQLPSSISASTILTADTIWYLADRVTVGNGNESMSATPGTLANGLAVQNVTLTIEAGTQIKARSGTFANMIITRGSKIMAEGTANAPIIFSSEDDNYDGTGEWGGLILHGYAQHNTCDTTPPATTCNVDSEGESGYAGGFNNADSSGVLKYVVVAEGGYEFAPGNEINGISFMGVGSGTVVDYIQVHNNKDDAIEMYGGTVNMKHLVLTNNLDDTIDWDEGYQGNIQYALVKQSAASDGNAIEADTDGNVSSSMLSKPTLANFTFIVDTLDSATPAAFNLKARTGGFFHNGIVTLAPSSKVTQCAKVATNTQVNRNLSLVLDNVIVNCGAFGDDTLSQATVFAVDPALAVNYTTAVSQARLSANYDFNAFKTAHNGQAAVIADPKHESVADTAFLEANNYLGAVNPDGSNLWYQGWTIEGSL